MYNISKKKVSHVMLLLSCFYFLYSLRDFPGCDVVNFEIILIFLIKPFFYMTKKSRQKFRCLENENIFMWNKKHFSSFFKSFQLPKIVSDLRVCRVRTVRENQGENGDFWEIQGKSGKFMESHGTLFIAWKNKSKKI